MWSKRTFSAARYTEAQEDGVEPTHSNCAGSNCAGSNCACASRVRISGASRHAHNRRNEDQPIGRAAKALIGAFA